MKTTRQSPNGMVPAFQAGARGSDSHLPHHIITSGGRLTVWRQLPKLVLGSSTLLHRSNIPFIQNPLLYANKGVGMKVQERESARRLRAEGKSVKDIAKELCVGRSSVSVWVKDIVLTDNQKTRLMEKMRHKSSYENMMAGCWVSSANRRLLRQKWQRDGRDLAKRREYLHAAGCMLYWAEGRRKNNKNSVVISNSDPNLLNVFITFLVKYYGVKRNEISFSVNHHDNIVDISTAEQYWSTELGLNPANKKAATVNSLSSYSKGKRCGSLKYGTCRLVVNKTEVLQKIYGAIQEYGNFKNSEWLG